MKNTYTVCWKKDGDELFSFELELEPADAYNAKMCFTLITNVKYTVEMKKVEK